jgi:indole-3-glycerol phosphate synthase
MGTILRKITDRIRQVEAGNFRNFEAPAALPGRRERVIDVLPLFEKGFFVIAETKKGSPSKGVIREGYDPVAIAEGYERGGAAAVSVITEEFFFFGSKEHLPQVKAVIDLPVLRKDFIIHPYQVYESYALGADLVLLIAACLTDEELEMLYRMVLSLGMQALVEVHNGEELQRVLTLNPRLIGINNRDLKTFKVDIETSFRLKRMIPADVFVISESGIGSSGDIKALKEAGFAGVLIGESLLRAPDPGKALARLIDEEK